MNSRIHGAMAEVMSRLKASDLAGATAAIRHALAGERRPAENPPGTAKRAAAAPASAAPRRLGDVIKILRAQRAATPPPPPRPQEDSEPGDGADRFAWRSHASAAGRLDYKLYVPTHRGRAPALVVMLHGCTQDPDDFARGTRMNGIAEEFGLVVAYPHQPRSGNARGCWNWFDPRHQSGDAGEPAMIAALARDLAAEFGIPPGRVFAAGLSAGAAMAEVLAETHPAVFAAVGLHSGLPHRSAHDVISAFAAMKGNGGGAPGGPGGRSSRKFILQGTADPTVSPANAEALFDRMQARYPRSKVVISESRSGGRDCTRQILIAASGEAVAEYLRVDGAGHAWAGGDPAGSFAESEGPDASREMIRFFLR